MARRRGLLSKKRFAGSHLVMQEPWRHQGHCRWGGCGQYSLLSTFCEALRAVVWIEPLATWLVMLGHGIQDIKAEIQLQRRYNASAEKENHRVSGFKAGVVYEYGS